MNSDWWDHVHVDQNAMATHLTRSDCEGFYEVVYIQCSRIDDYLLWNDSEDGHSDTDW